MRKKDFCRKVVGLGLSVALAFSSIAVCNPVRVSAYSIGSDENGFKVITGVSAEAIEQLDKVSIDSDLEMLDDIVERSYVNNFDIKSYIIKSKEPTLARTYWRDYLSSKGDVYVSAYFSECSIVYDGEYYYHDIEATSYPYWEMQAGYWDASKRKIKEDVYKAYKDAIEVAERNMGYVEGGNLCDWELLWGIYCYKAENFEYGGIDMSKGQSSVVGVTQSPHEVVCAGCARLFNRFCHDFGIDSYWVSKTKINHAWNYVKLGGEYWGADFNTAHFEQLNEYNQDIYSGDIPLYGFSLLAGGVKTEEVVKKEETDQSAAILHYKNKDFSYGTFKAKWGGLEFKPTIDENGYFQQLGPAIVGIESYNGSEIESSSEIICGDDPACHYCDKTHYYKWSKDIPVPAKEYKPSCEALAYSYSFGAFETGWTTSGYAEGRFNIYKKDKEGEYGTILETLIEEDEQGNILVENGVETTTKAKPVEPTTPEPTTKTEGTTEPKADVETTTVKEPEATTYGVTSEETTREEVKTTVTPTTATEKEEPTTPKAGIQNKKIPQRVKINLKKTKNIRKKSIVLTIKKARNAKKYQIQYSTNRKFKKAKIKTTKKLRYKIRHLVKGKTYYIRVRGINGRTAGRWSKVKKIRIKK